jgi:DNA uptake protein ComE-like DNA-binding protein
MKTVNINKANFQELMTIVHIGPQRALEITRLRPFKDVYELTAVKGLGSKRMDAILAEGKATVETIKKK